jgi:pimeloyl-ACP methyl ester carboxylesterase
MDEAAAGSIKMQARVTGSGAPLVLVAGGLTGWASWEPFDLVAWSFGGLVSLDYALDHGERVRFLEEVGMRPPGMDIRDLPQWTGWLPYRRSLRNGPAVVDHSDDPRRLRSLRRPVLLVKGTGSATFHHQIGDLLAAELPEALVVEMPGGHAPHIVSRDRFLRELARFHEGGTHGG